jgi:hypothetical protein
MHVEMMFPVLGLKGILDPESGTPHSLHILAKRGNWIGF